MSAGDHHLDRIADETSYVYAELQEIRSVLEQLISGVIKKARGRE